MLEMDNEYTNGTDHKAFGRRADPSILGDQTPRPRTPLMMGLPDQGILITQDLLYAQVHVFVAERLGLNLRAWQQNSGSQDRV
jgi:hypothetical protein